MELNEKDYQVYFRKAFLTSLGILKNKDDAEDIAQETIMSLILSDNIQKIPEWVFITAKNKSIEFIRKSQKRSKTIQEKKILSHQDTTPRREVIIPESKSYFNTLQLFFKAKNKLKRFSEENGLTYNQARAKIYAAMKNYKADKLNTEPLTKDPLTYSQSIILFRLIKRYMEAVKLKSPVPLKRYVNAQSQIEYIEFDTYMGNNIVKNGDDLVVMVTGKKSDQLVFVKMIFSFSNNKLRIKSIHSPEWTRPVSFDEKCILINDKTQNGVILSSLEKLM